LRETGQQVEGGEKEKSFTRMLNEHESKLRKKKRRCKGFQEKMSQESRPGVK
jgi:hypothetical protein